MLNDKIIEAIEKGDTDNCFKLLKERLRDPLVQAALFSLASRIIETFKTEFVYGNQHQSVIAHDVIKVLLERGLDPNENDKSESLLYTLIKGEHRIHAQIYNFKTAELLAVKTHKNKKSELCLRFLVESGYQKSGFLIEQGAELKINDLNGYEKDKWNKHVQNILSSYEDSPYIASLIRVMLEQKIISPDEVDEIMINKMPCVYYLVNSNQYHKLKEILNFGVNPNVKGADPHSKEKPISAIARAVINFDPMRNTEKNIPLLLSNGGADLYDDVERFCTMPDGAKWVSKKIIDDSVWWDVLSAHEKAEVLPVNKEVRISKGYSIDHYPGIEKHKPVTSNLSNGSLKL